MLRLPPFFRTFAFRTGVIRYFWRYRHLIDGRYRNAPTELISSDPHRWHWCDFVESLGAQSLLEVGCSDGANLSALAARLPHCALSAVDLNLHALEWASRRIQAIGGTLGAMRVAPAERLPYHDQAVDVVLSDAVFMYLTPSAAERAAREMLRVARLAIIIHSFADDRMIRSELKEGNWVHPIGRLMRDIIPGSVVKIEESLVRTGQWGQYGTIYQVTW